MDTGKRHSNGVMVQQLKWAENVLALIDRTIGNESVAEVRA